MGSYSAFTRHECPMCASCSVINFPDQIDICYACENTKALMARTTIVTHFHKIKLPAPAIADVQSFLQPLYDLNAEFRRLYLRQVLMQPWSPPVGQVQGDKRSVFHLFTYYGNGMAGTISQTEDVASRILSFVCGTSAHEL